MIATQIITTRDRVESTQLRDKYNKELRNNYELFINNHQLSEETTMIKKLFFFFLFTRFRKIFNELLKLTTRELRRINENTMCEICDPIIMKLRSEEENITSIS